MTEEAKILVVDDDPDVLTAAELLLRRRFGKIVTCSRPDDVPSLVAEHRPNVVLLDMNFGPGQSSGEQGLRWLKRILEIDPAIVVVMITAHGGVDVAVEAMKRGATDFVSKPWQNEKLIATVQAAVTLGQSRAEAGRLRAANRSLVEATTVPSSTILGSSRAIREVLDLVERAAPTDANVLILGEHGTGKELVARELHRRSRRAEQVFLSVDLGAISESLFESELYGHRKGAFTGAAGDRSGRFVAADRGTLFLDEIANLPLHLQPKLLTALEQREVTPVGSDRSVAVDVRVVSATNATREALADAKRFRPDLLFRLNTVEIVVPPLRERAEDVAPIARHYASVFARRYGKPDKSFSEAALAALEADPWPGNVRALRHAVERAVILSTTPSFEPADFPLSAASEVVAPVSPPATRTGSEADLNLERMEREAIRSALAKHGHNISRTARELGLTRAALYRRMEKHGL